MKELLIAEDDPEVLRALMRRLQGAGYGVSCCSNTHQTLAEQRVFDGYVLDIQLPDGCGVDAALALKSRGVLAPFVFFTGGASVSTLALASTVGSVVFKSEGVGAVLATLEFALSS